MRALPLLVLLAATTAHADPLHLAHQGRLTDGAGAPLDGLHTLEFVLYGDLVGGDPLWAEAQDVDFRDGYFAVELGADPFNLLDDELLAADDRYLALSVDGGPELNRIRLAAAPYARRAGVATDLRGGVVDAAEIRVGGEIVIDASGELAPGTDSDTLAELGCAIGEVPVWTGADWACTAGSGDTLDGLPCGPGDLAVFDGVSWVCAPLPADPLGDLACLPDQVPAWDGFGWVCADRDGDVSWSDLVDLPAELVDGDSDALGGLSCDPGAIPAWDGAAWRCTTDDDSLADLGCLAGELALWDGGAWICAPAISPTTWDDLIGVPPDLLDGDDDTLVALGCVGGQVARFDGDAGAWACASTDGDDDTLAELGCGDGQLAASSPAGWVCVDPIDAADVRGWVAATPIDLAAGSTVGGVSIATADSLAWGDLSGVPADLLDGDADSLAALGCDDGQRPGWDAGRSVWTCADDLVLTALEVTAIVETSPVDLAPGSTIGGAVPLFGPVTWGDVVGVPADLLDGDADSLAGLSCDPGQVLAYDGEGFGCADPEVASDTLADLRFFCEEGELAVFDADAFEWTCGPDRTLDADAVVAMLDGTDLDLGAGTTLGGEPIVTGEPFTADDAIAAIRDAGGVDEDMLPFNGLDELSNGILSNQFAYSYADGGLPIPDNNPLGAEQTIAVPDVGIAEWLTVTAEVENSDTTGLRLELTGPDDALIVLFDASEPGIGFTKTWPDPHPVLEGDLASWAGRNPAGDWTIRAIDTLYLDNTFDGEVVAWSVDLQTVSGDRIALDGRLEIADSLDVDADLTVGGDLTVVGSSDLRGPTSVGNTLDVAGRVTANTGVLYGDTEDPCDESTTGLVRFSDGYLRLCDGEVWRSISMDADGSVRALASHSCRALHDLAPGLPSGVYWIDPDGGDKTNAFEAWCDMERDGGGWTLVLQNIGSVRTTDASPSWASTTGEVVVRGGTLSDDLSAFDMQIGLAFWGDIGTEARIEVGAVAGTPVKQAFYDSLTLDEDDEFRLAMSGETVTLGDGSPGIYVTHNGQQWTTTDNDNDSHGENCADFYQHAWWYTSCWSGNLWGSEIGYSPNAYWIGASGDYHEWGAIWLR